MPTSLEYVLCNDKLSLSKALTAVSVSSAIAFDCEGLQLGQLGGVLSLITIGVVSPASEAPPFIIDVTVLDKQTLRPLFDLLESSLLTKIVFDGRMDYSALYHEFGASLQGVLDLQLADIHSRSVRGEGESGG